LKNNPSSDGQLRKELGSLGAREFEVVALTADVDRGLAALRQAIARGAEHPIPYAIKLYDKVEWQPSGEVRRLSTNVHAEVKCEKCGGDRLVPVTDDPSSLYGETWAPCSGCNADANTAFYRTDGTRIVSVAR
jgi:hypothetical protein